jgi:branched-chain amino acid aminotransferase
MAIPFDQRDGWIWFNGEIVPWKEAKVHVLTHGLHYGSSVFEGERAYDGVIFKSTEHSIRFKKSAEIMDFEIPYSVEELNAAKDKVVELNGGGTTRSTWRSPPGPGPRCSTPRPR